MMTFIDSMCSMAPGVLSRSDCCFQVIASVLRNLSWRADVNSKKTLREVGSVRALMGCALEVQKVNPSWLRLCLVPVLSAVRTVSLCVPGIDAEVCTERALEPLRTLH